MKFLKLIICVLLSLSLVGCAVSKNPNPRIRYGANTAATMALPGAIAAASSGTIICASGLDIHALVFGVISVGAAGAGYVAGALLGGTVGFFKWMINGFEKDNVSDYGSLPEEILPPVKSDENGDNL